MNDLVPNIVAEIYYLTSEEGGRETPCTNGYRPQFKISEMEIQTSASQQFIEKEWVKPGETVTAEITLLEPLMFKEFLHQGTEFELKEGAITVARGKILEILSLDRQDFE